MSDITIDVAAAVCADLAGNANLAATQKIVQRLAHLLRDEFTSDDAAPLASPRTCEPGPGTLTAVQNDGQLSISSGALTFPVQSTPVNGDQGLIGPATARAVGLAFIAKVNYSTLGNNWLAWASANSVNFAGHGNVASGLYIQATAVSIIDNAAISMSVLLGALSTGTDYEIAIVLRSAGAFYFIKGGAYTDWTLFWQGGPNTSATVYAAFSNSAAAGSFPYWRTRALRAPFTTDEGIASVDQATAVSDTSYTATADAIHRLAITAPDPLANTCELRYRVTDDQNYWTMYCNDAGALRVDSVSGGVATNRKAVASVIAAGASITLRAIVQGTVHNHYTLAGTTWTARGSTINLSHQNTATAVKPVAGAGWTLGALRSYPRTSALFAELDKT